MHRAKPPRREAYIGRPKDYSCACCVWISLVSASTGFVILRTVELRLRLNSSERTVSHLTTRDFPRPMLDICELDNSKHNLSVLSKFTVDLDEAWGSTQQPEVLHDHESVSKSYADIPSSVFSDGSEQEDSTRKPVQAKVNSLVNGDVESASSESGYKCVRFKAKGTVPKDTIWYEAEFDVRLNLTKGERNQRSKSIVRWNNVDVMTDHFFRFSLSDEIASPLSAKVETLRLTMIPFTSPGLEVTHSGTRKLKAVGSPTYHQWIDSLGTRRGATENDKALLDRSEFDGGPAEVHAGEPRLSLKLLIPSCKSMLHIHINDVFSDVLAWMTSVLAVVAVFNIMTICFIPVLRYKYEQGTVDNATLDSQSYLTEKAIQVACNVDSQCIGYSCISDHDFRKLVPGDHTVKAGVLGVEWAKSKIEIVTQSRFRFECCGLGRPGTYDETRPLMEEEGAQQQNDEPADEMNDIDP